jgi:hypothetical protein
MVKTAFRAQMETLERRETPTASPGIHALAGSAVTVNGSGTGQVTSEVSLPSSLALTANISGKDARLGGFTGQVMGQIFISKPSSSASGTATLTVATGATVDLSLTGKIRMTKHASAATGSFKFNVLDGTGALVGATGSGTGTGTINETTGALTFKYHGRVRP